MTYAWHKVDSYAEHTTRNEPDSVFGYDLHCICDMLHLIIVQEYKKIRIRLENLMT